MSNPVCTTASLNIACFRGYNLTRLQRMAYMIWYLANELKAIGGTDYTTNLTNSATSLRTVTQSQFKNWNRDEMQEALVAIYYNNAVNAGASVTNVPNTVQTKIKHLVSGQVPEDDLEKMWIELLCQLGVHKSFPQ